MNSEYIIVNNNTLLREHTIVWYLEKIILDYEKQKESDVLNKKIKYILSS